MSEPVAPEDAWETRCPKSEDGWHCTHWYDGEPCCACGDNDPSSLPTEEVKP